MPHLRYSKLKDKWVIIAKNRAKRPEAFRFEIFSNKKESPFVYGNEHLTPPETFAIRQKGSQSNKEGWFCRVVPNKYHALAIEEVAAPFLNGFFEGFGGFGAHEVIIDTPNDTLMPHEYSIFDWLNILISIKERMSALFMDPRFKYISIFKNHGYNAGATIAHPHTQLLALPILSSQVKKEITIALDYFKKTGRVLQNDEVNEELRLKDRIIFENTLFVAFCPFASAFSFEIEILPKENLLPFYMCERDVFIELSSVLSFVLKRLNIALPNSSYNMIFNMHPSHSIQNELSYPYKIEHFYRWYVEIIPRIYGIGGFELGNGIFINPILPEEAAAFLRNI